MVQPHPYTNLKVVAYADGFVQIASHIDLETKHRDQTQSAEEVGIVKGSNSQSSKNRKCCRIVSILTYETLSVT